MQDDKRICVASITLVLYDTAYTESKNVKFIINRIKIMVTGRRYGIIKGMCSQCIIK